MTTTSHRPPVTAERLQRDLAALGVEAGEVLLVHSSLSALGWVAGGAPTVVRALLDLLGEGGTLAMPAATPQCADPANWREPRLSGERLRGLRELLPMFERESTPTLMGAIPEAFRTWPGTLRSDHPLESVCARGPAAAAITGEHPLAFSEGPGGPFGKLHDLDCRILLLGVGFNRCTALHFAETLVATRRVTRLRFPLMDRGRRVWVEVLNVDDDNDAHFPAIGERYVAARRAEQGSVGAAPSTLVDMRDLVEFAVGYFEEHLSAPPPRKEGQCRP